MQEGTVAGERELSEIIELIPNKGSNHAGSVFYHLVRMLERRQIDLETVAHTLISTVSSHECDRLGSIFCDPALASESYQVCLEARPHSLSSTMRGIHYDYV